MGGGVTGPSGDDPHGFVWLDKSRDATPPAS